MELKEKRKLEKAALRQRNALEVWAEAYHKMQKIGARRGRRLAKALEDTLGCLADLLGDAAIRMRTEFNARTPVWQDSPEGETLSSLVHAWEEAEQNMQGWGDILGLDIPEPRLVSFEPVRLEETIELTK